MIATLAIHLAALVALLLVGAGALALCAPDQPPWRAAALPMGVVSAVVVLYPLSYAVTVPAAGLILVVAAAAALVWWVWRRGRAAGTAPRGWRADAAVGATGVAAGVLALAPLFRIGFPTTIAATIADGWSYVSEIAWLRHHRLGDAASLGIDNPLDGIYPGQVHAGFGAGFEMIATGILALTGREPFEIVGPVSAVAFPVAVVSWVELWRAVRDDTPRLAALPVAAAAASPLLVMVYSENQVPHLLGLAVLPFALASAVRFARAPGPRTLVVAAVASAGTLGVYTGLLPWLLAGLPAAVVAGRPPGPRRLRTALLPIGALAVAAAAVGVLPLRQAIRFVGAAGGETGVDAPSVHASDGVLMASGAAVRRAFAGFTQPDWREIAAGLVILVAVVVAAVVVARARGRGAAGAAGWAALGLLLATGVVVVNFLIRDDSGGYGIWKGLVSGGALCAGALLVVLVPARRGQAVRAAAVAACAAVWITTSAGVLQGADDAGQQGFRTPDVEMGRALDRLPEGSNLLVEGVDPGPAAFRMRMMAAYFGTEAAGLTVDGLGTTPSYIAGGGEPAWRPARAWRWVLTTAPGITDGTRPTRYANDVYRLAEAPEVDVTPWAGGWNATETVDGRPAAWTSGDAELVVSNRSDRPRRAVLRFDARSHAVPRDLRVTAEGVDATVRVPADAAVPVAIPIPIPADSAAPVTLSTDPPPQPGPPGDPRDLGVLVSGVRIG
ncbi:MAG: hypothetical protein AB7O78_07595 [Thermoleophilia bacterium]